MPACADLELCKAQGNPPLGERDGHGCRAGRGGRLHGMCGEQEEGESEMHRICNPCLDKKQKGSGGSSNQPKRRSPASAFLQQGASKKKASSASASRKRLTLAQKLEVLKLLDQKVSYAEIARRFGNGTTAIGTIKQERSKLEGDAASSARSASSKSSRGGDFPKVRPLLWFKIEQEERTNSSFAETCPPFFCVSLLCSHTFFKLSPSP